MNKILITLILLASFIISNAQGIKFEDHLSWVQIKEKAAREKKYIFVDCYATWCGPCKAMDSQVYSSQVAGDTFNEKFISVKVQMDKTDSDNEQIKFWYDNAVMLNSNYHIQAYPTLLFFSPEGKLIYRREGATNVKGFLELTQKAINSEKDNLPFIEKYMRGEANLIELPEIENKARALGNDELATEISLKYIHDYLNRLSDAELLTAENFKYLNYYKHQALLTQSDNIFKLSLKQPELVAQSLRIDNGKDIAAGVIYRDLLNAVTKDKPANLKKPNWKAIARKVRRDYGEYYTVNTLLDVKKQYYFDLKDWVGFADAVDEIIATRPLNNVGTGYSAGRLNMDAWWGIFKNSDDPKLLKRALDWGELVLKYTDIDKADEFVDTHANLLYKLGEIEKAIAEEQQLIERILNRPGKVSDELDEFKKTLNKMKRGEPTW